MRLRQGNIYILTLVFFFSLEIGARGNYSYQLRRIDKMLSVKEYESAYRLLTDIDRHDTVVPIVIAKSNLLLDYFINSYMHYVFELKDIPPRYSLMRLRGTKGSYIKYKYAIDSILLNNKKRHPNNFKIDKTLGKFYFQIHTKYGSKWKQHDSITLNKAIKYYRAAIENGEFDYQSCFNLGYCYLVKHQFKTGIQYLQKSAELKPDFANAYYNLAYAFLNLEKRRLAISSGKLALKYYQDKKFKADAARMVGLTFGELQRDEESYKYYRISDSIMPNHVITKRALVDLELKLDKPTLKSTSEVYLDLAPQNSGVYEDLYDIFILNNKENKLIEILENQKDKYHSNLKVLGNLHLYIGKIHYYHRDSIKASQNLRQAKQMFQRVYPQSHWLFKLINHLLKNGRSSRLTSNIY
jgi:tetratricopeptide (TPR) repeat protein